MKTTDVILLRLGTCSYCNLAATPTAQWRKDYHNGDPSFCVGPPICLNCLKTIEAVFEPSNLELIDGYHYNGLSESGGITIERPSN